MGEHDAGSAEVAGSSPARSTTPEPYVSAFAPCPICRESVYLKTMHSAYGHKCKPVWECKFVGWDNDYYCGWKEVRATDAENAAELFVELYDQDTCEYEIVSGRAHDVQVMVRKPLEDEWIEITYFDEYSGEEMYEEVHREDVVGPIKPEYLFDIRAEIVPHYRAYSVAI